MVNLTHIPKHTLKAEVIKQPLVYAPTVHKMRVAVREDRIAIIADEERFIEIGPIEAHELGKAIALAQVDSDEMIRVSLDGEAIDLPFDSALQFSAGLLRKADAADDWQLNLNLRRKQ